MLRITLLALFTFIISTCVHAQLTMTCGDKTITVDSLTKVPAAFFTCGELTLKIDRPERKLDANIILFSSKGSTAYFQTIYFVNGIAKVPQNFLYSRDWNTKVIIQIKDKSKVIKAYSYLIQKK